MSLKKHLIKELLSNKEYLYRVYKKSITEYRVEKRDGNRWVEIETDQSIEQILLSDCRMVVDENGRQDTLDNTGQSSSSVAVHAWIECNGYQIDKNIDSPDGILYYNPYKVTQFLDRESFESGNPEVIEKCEFVSTDGNNLNYKGATKTRRDDKVLDDNMELLMVADNVNESSREYLINVY